MDQSMIVERAATAYHDESEQRDAQTNNEEPGVINSGLLVRLAIEQAGAKGVDDEARKLHLQDGIKLDEIQDIRIEFMNILKIDNLWIVAKSLTRLKLSNNAIEKIENLDSLVNLCELDLSFNRIEIIENLDDLVNLKILLLYANEISDICNGGIDRLTEKLAILSIGANKIVNWEHVMYLRQFKKLRSLNVTGNSCTNRKGYFDYLVAFLPQIVYLDYKMLSDTEREHAQEKHQRAIAILEEKEANDRAELEEKRIVQERIAVFSLSFVEYLDGDEFFQHMYEHDREGRELSLLNDETRATYEDYRKNFTEFCLKLYELGLTQRERRNEEIGLFKKIVDEGREAVYTEARTMMDDIIARKMEIFEQVGAEAMRMNKNTDNETAKTNIIESGSGDDIVVNDDRVVEEKIEKAHRLADEFNGLLLKTWNRLMHQEVILHQQIEVYLIFDRLACIILNIKKIRLRENGGNTVDVGEYPKNSDSCHSGQVR